MKVLGIDPATTTGYAIVEFDNDKTTLLDYGSISTKPSLEWYKRLNVYYEKLTDICKKYNPDNIVIEDLIMNHSAVTTMSCIGRVNGVCLLVAGQNCDNVKIVHPQTWKSKQLNEIKGNSVKCEIQLQVCKKFKLLDDKKINKYKADINNIIDTYGRKSKDQKKEFMKIERQIAKETGLTEDMADSVAMCFCG